MNKKYIGAALGVTTLAAMAIPAFAESNQTITNNRQNQEQYDRRENLGNKGRGMMPGNTQMMSRPTVSGTVTIVSGNTITISGHQGIASSSTPLSTFVIDATNAKIIKGDQTTTITTIVAGDTIAVHGTLTGNTVVATMIRDGVMMRRDSEGRGMMNPTNSANTQAIQQLQGNGQPIIAGTITAISGTSLTITNKSNVTYTAETSAAKVIINGAVSAITSAKIGDMVIVQGTIHGNAITASSVIDNGTAPAAATTNQSTGNTTRGGFFGGIGNFFGKMFGF